ncbi:MAG TPA: cytochrome c oxidase subunit II [Rhizomicrobium sp.]|jgi:cytochrome c oxidase subunit 2|nr:cytochrome c oxidase subunit II [Rhizomicrobium sp.]
MRVGPPLIPLAATILCGCSSWQSALDPHSAEAGHLADLFWFFTAVCAAIWILVTASLLHLGLRRRRDGDIPREDSPEERRRKMLIVGALVALTAVILAIFSFASFYATRGFAWANQTALTIKVKGNQWWWPIQYESRDVTQIFDTANEIHIPVKRPVTFDLEASDVIHSLWIPDLMGKQDLIPGRNNTLTVEADRAGLYRAQCAEYCGLQHAHMALYVFAEPEKQFEAWRGHQLAPARPPASGKAWQGYRVFLAACAGCHTVRGTDAGGQLGPDLTHFGSRAAIAAGELHNTQDNLSNWLADPQSIKPGNYMPRVPLSDGDRAAVVAYLQGLK